MCCDDGLCLIDGVMLLGDVKCVFDFDDLFGEYYVEMFVGLVIYVFKCIFKKSEIVDIGLLYIEVFDIDNYCVD